MEMELLKRFVIFFFIKLIVRGRVVKVFDLKPLAPHHCRFESRQGLWILSCEEAIQLVRNVDGSTQVPVRAWNNARKGTWGLPPPVKLERRDMTYTVSMWRKTQLNLSICVLFNCAKRVKDTLSRWLYIAFCYQEPVSCQQWRIYFRFFIALQSINFRDLN
jgi:hypothetical protein